jgi:hypothetical protein
VTDCCRLGHRPESLGLAFCREDLLKNPLSLKRLLVAGVTVFLGRSSRLRPPLPVTPASYCNSRCFSIGQDVVGTGPARPTRLLWRPDSQAAGPPGEGGSDPTDAASAGRQDGSAEGSVQPWRPLRGFGPGACWYASYLESCSAPQWQQQPRGQKERASRRRDAPGASRPCGGDLGRRGPPSGRGPGHALPRMLPRRPQLLTRREMAVVGHRPRSPGCEVAVAGRRKVAARRFSGRAFGKGLEEESNRLGASSRGAQPHFHG